MKQPTKDALRDQLALAADEIIRLRLGRMMDADRLAVRATIARLKAQRPWWRRWFA